MLFSHYSHWCLSGGRKDTISICHLRVQQLRYAHLLYIHSAGQCVNMGSDRSGFSLLAHKH